MGAVLGICIAAFYRGPGETGLRLTMFLVLGWSCIIYLRRIIAELPRPGMALLFIGGVLYTAGVPFFVRGGHVWQMPDHSIWHLFVLSASICHFFAIYLYVADRKPNEGSAENSLGVPLVPM